MRQAMNTKQGKTGNNVSDQSYLNKLHREILSILDEVVKVCEKNNIKYYLIGGSLLGAARHKGFIPWDDDLDIIMPRADFEKFTKTAYKQLPETLELEWINTDPKYNQCFAKVCDRRTRFEEELIEGVVSNWGIFIDIFVMDTTDGNIRILKIRKKVIEKFKSMLFSKAFEDQKKGLKRLIIKCISEKKINFLINKVMRMSESRNGEYYSNFGSQRSIEKQTYKKSLFGEGCMMPFEDRAYKVPEKYSDVLSLIFGKDYLELPPLEKRRTHYPLRVVFSDGQEIVFEKIENKIQIDDE